MKDYQGELNKIIQEYNLLGDIIYDLHKYTEYPNIIQKDLLQELVNEKLEQESRKDYLKVGSKWECVLDLICPCLEHSGGTKVGYELLYETRVVTIVEVVNNYVKFKMDDYLCVIGLPQFLFCCRPIKEGE